MSVSADFQAQPETFPPALDTVLSPLHDAWVEEARRFLEPAATASPPFWDRWSVVRYLNDQFQARYALERALLEELRPFLQAHHLDAIAAGEERVARLRLGLDRIGRRRGTAAEFAHLTGEFLTALELWCAEIELAVGHIEPGDLPEEGARILARLESAVRPTA